MTGTEMEGEQVQFKTHFQTKRVLTQHKDTGKITLKYSFYRISVLRKINNLLV